MFIQNGDYGSVSASNAPHTASGTTLGACTDNQNNAQVAYGNISGNAYGGTCPHCGRCPHCGQQKPSYPWYWPYTYYNYPATTIGGASLQDYQSKQYQSGQINVGQSAFQAIN